MIGSQMIYLLSLLGIERLLNKTTHGVDIPSLKLPASLSPRR